MVFGHNRIPIVSWLRDQATEALAHAQEAGELITHLGEHPSLSIGPLLEMHQLNINEILLESLREERRGLALYKELLEISRDKSMLIEEYARRLITAEEMHVGEVDKMLRKPGDVKAFAD